VTGPHLDYCAAMTSLECARTCRNPRRLLGLDWPSPLVSSENMIPNTHRAEHRRVLCISQRYSDQTQMGMNVIWIGFGSEPERPKHFGDRQFVLCRSTLQLFRSHVTGLLR
jgi:hypothetical protein